MEFIYFNKTSTGSWLLLLLFVTISNGRMKVTEVEDGRSRQSPFILKRETMRTKFSDDEETNFCLINEIISANQCPFPDLVCPNKPISRT